MNKNLVYHLILCLLHLPLKAAENNVAQERKRIERKHSLVIEVRLYRDPKRINYKVLRDVYDKLFLCMSNNDFAFLSELHSKAKDDAYVWSPQWYSKLRKTGLIENNQFVHHDIARAICALLDVGPSNYILLSSPESCVKRWLS